MLATPLSSYDCAFVFLINSGLSSSLLIFTSRSVLYYLVLFRIDQRSNHHSNNVKRKFILPAVTKAPKAFLKAISRRLHLSSSLVGKPKCLTLHKPLQLMRLSVTSNVSSFYHIYLKDSLCSLDVPKKCVLLTNVISKGQWPKLEPVKPESKTVMIQD